MPDRFTDEDRARLEALGQYVDCEVALRALAHINHLEKALVRIANSDDNPAFPADHSGTFRDCARAALKGEDEARSGSAGSPEMGALACLHAAEAEKDEWQAMAEKCEARVGEYEQVLTLIAAPKRSDGTYNRDREACEQLARDALKGENDA